MESPLKRPAAGRIRLATLALRISEGIYILLGLCLPISMISFQDVREQYPIWIGLCAGVFIVGFAVFIEIVVQALNRGKFWAWVAGLCLSGLYIPSLFLPLGVMGLIGLLDPVSQAAFGVGPKSTPNR